MTTPARHRPGRHPGGRPSKWTPEIERSIATWVEGGAAIKDAAPVYGLDYETVDQWMVDGKKEAATCPWNAGEQHAHAKTCSGRMHSFYRAITVARHRARALASARVFREQPGFWLRFHPENGMEWAGPSLIRQLRAESGPGVSKLTITEMLGLAAETVGKWEPLEPDGGNGAVPVVESLPTRATFRNGGRANGHAQTNGA